MIFLNIRTFSIYYMIALVLRSRSAGSSVDFSVAASQSGENAIFDQIRQAEALRDVGKSFLSTKQYSKAALCYAAVLQVIEGVGGAESGELRRRCGLTLAECEIKSGNLYAAIARCSEVIEECPDIVDIEPTDEDQFSRETEITTEMGKLRQALGQAFYRRGVSLKRLDEPELAMLDLQEALKKIPNDQKILQRIETAESIILGHNATREGQQAPTEGELREQLRCIVEDAQANYERSYFSKRQIRDLLQKKQALRKTRSISQGGDFGGLGDLFSSAIGGSKQNSGSGLGGLGGIGSLLGAAAGGGSGTAGLLGSLGMMLRMFSGFDNDTISLIEEIAKAILDVFQVFKRSFQWIMSRRTQIVLVCSFLWALFVSRAYLIKL